MRVILPEAVGSAVKGKVLFKAETIATRDYQFNRDAANER